MLQGEEPTPGRPATSYLWFLRQKLSSEIYNNESFTIDPKHLISNYVIRI